MDLESIMENSDKKVEKVNIETKRIEEHFKNLSAEEFESNLEKCGINEEEYKENQIMKIISCSRYSDNSLICKKCKDIRFCEKYNI